MERGNRQRMRRKARRILLQVLYEVDVAAHPLEVSLNHVLGEGALDEENAAFVVQRVTQVLAHGDHLDSVIQEYAPSWPVSQLSAVDRNILRIAIYELMMAKDIPPKVAVNEAIELAKQFGAEASPRFVNGVLGSVLGSVRAEESGETPAVAQEVDGAQSSRPR